jgi:hypothetical protein
MASRRIHVADLFGRPGYVRVPNPERQQKDGHRRYKKGWEVRLVAADEAEVRLLERMAATLDYAPGASFRKGRKFVVPIYGESAVRAFRRVRVSLAGAASEEP